jgi:hypothetical protein
MHALEPAWEHVKRDFDAASSQAARSARSQVVHELNQLLRRFRQYKTEEDWVRLVTDGAAAFASQVAVFSLEGNLLRLRGQVNLQLPEGLSFPLASAAAFQSVSASNDPLTALRTPAEVTDALSTPTGEGRAYLFPIGNGARLAAILFAAGEEEIDANALELIAGLASSILERRSNASLHSQISPLPAPPRGARLPAWAGLDEKQRQLHLRARRFARVTVAGMQLAKPEACRAGREQRDLYLFLQKEIDEAREIYGKQFMTISSMVDYLHMEFVGTAAEGDHLKLGADYPGQLL